MACFLLRTPEGAERWMAEHEAYRLQPGEFIVEGMIDWNCGPNPGPQPMVVFRKCSNCGELGIYEST
jgi:hypothetical protein